MLVIHGALACILPLSALPLCHLFFAALQWHVHFPAYLAHFTSLLHCSGTGGLEPAIVAAAANLIASQILSGQMQVPGMGGAAAAGTGQEGYAYQYGQDAAAQYAAQVGLVCCWPHCWVWAVAVSLYSGRFSCCLAPAA